jgi:N-acylglucosamine 2-epimerase
MILEYFFQNSSSQIFGSKIMNRRGFLRTACIASSAPFCWGFPADKAFSAPSAHINLLAGFTLKELQAQYHSYLFDDFLPFMEKYVIDTNYGGFLTNCDRDGARLGTSKSPTNEGRGIWVWSLLYNELAREQKYLDTAKRSLDLILKTIPVGDSLWPAALTQDGKAASAADVTIYGDLYLAAGIAEYAFAARDTESWKLAKNIMEKCIRIYDQPDYNSITGANPIQGPRRQNVSMLILPTTTSLLKYQADSAVEAAAARCVDAVTNYHYNPLYQLNNDYLNHDYSRPNNNNSKYIAFGISNQTLWMVLKEALRLKDSKMYDTIAERIKHHVEAGWDEVYGGEFSTYSNIETNSRDWSKTLHNQTEALVGLLSVIENSGDPRAQELFSQLYTFTTQKYVLKKYGYPLWQHDADRYVTYQPHTTRAEHFHNSRHLMMNLTALNRMIAKSDNTKVNSPLARPEEMRITSLYPNPFNFSQTIEFSLPSHAYISLDIYNISGQKIRELVSGYKTSGNYKTIWNGKDGKEEDVSSGIYIVKLMAGNHISTTKTMLLR